MDLASTSDIVNNVVLMLAPAMTTAIGRAGEDLIKSIGQFAGERAAALFNAISQKAKGNPAAEETLKDFTEAPDDKDVQGALRHQLKKLLESDEAFTHEVRRLLATGGDVTITTTVTASGERSVALGRDSHAPVITGDIVQGAGVEPKQGRRAAAQSSSSQARSGRSSRKGKGKGKAGG